MELPCFQPIGIKNVRHDPMRMGDAGKKTGNPEPATQIGLLIALFLINGSGRHRHQRHATLRTIARMILDHFRMHRASVHRLRSGFPRGIALQRHAAFWAVAGLVRLHASTHRAEVLGGDGGLHLFLAFVFVVTAGVI